VLSSSNYEIAALQAVLGRLTVR